MGHHAQATRMEIQTEYTALLLSYIYKYLKKHEKSGDKEHIVEILEFIKDLGLTNEHLKEHLMTLCMDKKVVESFDNVASTTKSAFTRLFNQENKDDLVGKKGKKSGGSAAGKTTKAAADDEEIEAEEEEEE